MPIAKLHVWSPNFQNKLLVCEFVLFALTDFAHLILYSVKLLKELCKHLQIKHQNGLKLTKLAICN